MKLVSTHLTVGTGDMILCCLEGREGIGECDTIAELWLTGGNLWHSEKKYARVWLRARWTSHEVARDSNRASTMRSQPPVLWHNPSFSPWPVPWAPTSLSALNKSELFLYLIIYFGTKLSGVRILAGGGGHCEERGMVWNWIEVAWHSVDWITCHLPSLFQYSSLAHSRARPATGKLD